MSGGSPPLSEVLATAGQGYKAKADRQKSADRIKNEAATDKLKFETYEDKAKEHRWRCKAAIQITPGQGTAEVTLNRYHQHNRLEYA